MNISVVVIVKNGEKHIKNLLDSLVSFDDVVIYENGSTDKTVQIAKQYKNVHLIYGEFEGFGKTKNKASTYAKHEWILSLDSDESIDEKLVKELVSLNLTDKKEIFYIKRDNYFLGKKVKYSGWGDNWLVRLYNREYHQFNNNNVHEFVTVKKDAKVTYLKNSFRHDAVDNLNTFLEKHIRYSDLASEGKKSCSFILVVLRANFAFFKTYIIKLGFLDGWRGFVIAVSNFIGKFFRYAKRYVNCKKQ